MYSLPIKIASGAVSAALVLAGHAAAQVKHYSLENSRGLRLHNVAAEPAVMAGKKGLRITFSEEALRRFKDMTPNEQAQAQARVGQYAIIENLEFADGVIEAEISGEPAVGAPAFARGFAGIAFRLRNGNYDAFYLRPTNGRADDQERRNHATQYVSLPDWPWSRLRKETPDKYEAYVDLQPGVWTKIRIEVRGQRAFLYVHGQAQPTLVVNDLKSGAQGSGGIALWIDTGTVAHFRNLKVTPDSNGPIASGPVRP